MSELQTARLTEAVRGLTDKVRRFREQYRERSLGEQNTKAALITPLLEALGWNTRDPDEVHHEYRPTPKDNPVDYCLRLERSPKLLVEAKGFGEDLSDHKWLRQTLGYATMAGAEWCVLTDGNEYRLYNATAPVEAEQKLFFCVSLIDGRPEEVVKGLSLISRSNMTGPLLSEHWKRYHADRRVKGAVRELFDEAHQELVPLIRNRLRDLSEGEIAQSIRRLDIRIEAAESPYEPGKPPKLIPPTGKEPVVPEPPARPGTLANLIAAGILTAPLKLFRKYKGQTVEADLLPDGKVKFQGVAYDSCSKAAGAARGHITGRGPMNTNGWVFWQYRDANEKLHCLDDARRYSVNAGKGEGNNDPTREKPPNAAQTRILQALAAADRPLNKAAIIEQARIPPNYVAEYCGHTGEMKSEYVLGNGPKKLVPAGLVSIVMVVHDGREQKSYTLTAAGVELAKTLAAGKPPSPSRQDQPERYDLRQRFWDGLLSRPKAKDTRHANITASGEFHYIGAGSGVGRLSFNHVIRKEEVTVELYIDRGAGKRDENKRMFDWLHKRKGEIEQAFGGGLDWQRLDDKQGCRIAYTITVGGYRSDESKWPVIQDAMIEAMTRLENALTPHLPKLNAEFAS